MIKIAKSMKIIELLNQSSDHEKKLNPVPTNNDDDEVKQGNISPYRTNARPRTMPPIFLTPESSPEPTHQPHLHRDQPVPDDPDFSIFCPL
jgi:hypothetical protein